MASKQGANKGAVSKAVVMVTMGSDSDWSTMRGAVEALEEFGVPYKASVLSAHRTPDEVAKFAKTARKQGVKVIIAGAGGAAHLPGMIASYTELPVIGVPVPLGPLSGEDALYSIVQMPKGVPVATVAIGNSFNAGVLAAQILGINSKALWDRISEYKKALRRKVLSKKIKV